VTFLWRGSATTTNVLLERGRFTRFNPQQNLFAHIEGTQVWFKTLLLPSASRFQYAISENDPNGRFPPGPEQRNERYDSLNPKHLPDDPDSPESSWHSFLDLPSAPSQPWCVKHDNLPKYEEKDVELQSKILGEKRELKVYLPPAYSAGSSTYPTLYLFDGEDENGLVFATWTLENLVAAQRIPPLVVVRIVNPSPAAREKELGCLPGFADFLSNELVPFIKSHYRVNSSPAETGIGGYSRGGLAAAYAVLQHPETFGLALVQSGAFWWEPAERADLYVEPNWIANQFVGKPHLPVRFYLEAGLFEIDLQGAGGDILETTRTLRDVLQAEGYEVSYNEFAGDHDYINWRGTFADGLIALFGTSSKNANGVQP
jgi:enterochelin esterase family protein